MASGGRADGLRARRPSCATRSGPSSGRWRARRWRPSRGPSWTCVGTGPAGQPGGDPAVRHPRREADRARRVPARGRSRGDRRRGAGELPRAVLRPRRRPSRARSTCRPRWRTRPTSRRSWRSGAAGPSACAVPQRGEKRELLALATRNAAETLAREQARWLADEGKTLAALEELAAALGLAGPPLRIECYDISNFQGSESVGSMVVFEDGKPRTGEYRRFRIKTVTGRRTTSPATRRSCAAASGRPRPARRASRRRGAGRCRTS